MFSNLKYGHIIHTDAERKEYVLRVNAVSTNSPHLNSILAEQAQYYHSLPNVQPIPVELLINTIQDDLKYCNRRTYGKFSASRLLSCSHEDDQLVVFAGGPKFDQIVLKNVMDCIESPYQTATKRNTGFSLGINGGHEIQNILYAGSEYGFQSSSDDNSSSKGSSHILLNTKYSIQHLRTVRVNINESRTMDNNPLAVGVGGSHASKKLRIEAWHNILEPIQHWDVNIPIKHMCTWQLTNNSLSDFVPCRECGNYNYHIASVLTENGDVLSWNATSGLLNSRNNSTERGLYYNKDKYACVEYSHMHPHAVYVSLSGNVCVHDYRCDNVFKGTVTRNKLYSCNELDENNAILSMKKKTSRICASSDYQLYLSVSHRGSNINYRGGGVRVGASADICIIDIRYPKHYLERYPIPSNSSDVVGAPTTPPYDSIQVYTIRNDENPSNEDTILLGSHRSSRCIHLNKFQYNNANLPQTTCSNGTTGLSSFLMASKPFGFMSVQDTGKPTHTPYSFLVNDQACNVVAENRFKGDSNQNVEDHGITNAYSDSYLCGMFLLNISKEVQKLREGAQSSGLLSAENGKDTIGKEMVVCQFNNFGNLYMQEWVESDSSSAMDYEERLSKKVVDMGKYSHSNNYNPLGLGITPGAYGNALCDMPTAQSVELNADSLMSSWGKSYNSKYYRQWVFDENSHDFSLCHDDDDELTGLTLLSSPVDTPYEHACSTPAQSIMKFNNRNCILSKIMVRCVEHVLRIYRGVACGEYMELRFHKRNSMEARENRTIINSSRGVGKRKIKPVLPFYGSSDTAAQTGSDLSTDMGSDLDSEEHSDVESVLNGRSCSAITDRETGVDISTDSSISDEDIDLLPDHWRNIIVEGKKHVIQRNLLSSQEISCEHLQKLCNYKHQDKVYNILHDFLLFNIKKYARNTISIYEVCSFLWQHIIPRKATPPGLILKYKVVMQYIKRFLDFEIVLPLKNTQSSGDMSSALLKNAFNSCDCLARWNETAELDDIPLCYEVHTDGVSTPISLCMVPHLIYLNIGKHNPPLDPAAGPGSLLSAPLITSGGKNKITSSNKTVSVRASSSSVSDVGNDIILSLKDAW